MVMGKPVGGRRPRTRCCGGGRAKGWRGKGLRPKGLGDRRGGGGGGNASPSPTPRCVTCPYISPARLSSISPSRKPTSTQRKASQTRPCPKVCRETPQRLRLGCSLRRRLHRDVPPDLHPHARARLRPGLGGDQAIHHWVGDLPARGGDQGRWCRPDAGSLHTS